MTENQGNQAAAGAGDQRVVVAVADREAAAKAAAAVLGAAPEDQVPRGALGDRAAEAPIRHQASAEPAEAKAVVVVKGVPPVQAEAAARKVAQADRAAALAMAVAAAMEGAATPGAMVGSDLIDRTAVTAPPTRSQQRFQQRQRVCPAT